MGAGPGRDKEDGGRVSAEVMTHDVESPGRVTEGGGDLGGGASLDKEGAQGFVLALSGGGGLEEELPESTYVFGFL